MTDYPTSKPAPPGWDPGVYHARTLAKGANRALYWTLRVILQPVFHVYFRLSRYGREHVPKEGPVILASNHRSFLDPLVIGTLTRRPVYYVAKKELFTEPLAAWIMNMLGAFPVDRGASDTRRWRQRARSSSAATASCIFPEGTRTRPGPLGSPHRGVGRLALQTGARSCRWP